MEIITNVERDRLCDRRNTEVKCIYFVARGNKKFIWVYYVILHKKYPEILELITNRYVAVFNYTCYKNYSNYIVTKILKINYNSISLFFLFGYSLFYW